MARSGSLVPPGGHRVYSAANVERLTRLKRLVNQDHRISDLASLTAADLDARLAAMFHFARRADLNSLRDAGVHTVQAPATAAELWWLVQQIPRRPAPAEAVLPPPAMHAFLHRETARARAFMEVALLRVAEAESIDY